MLADIEADLQNVKQWDDATNAEFRSHGAAAKTGKGSRWSFLIVAAGEVLDDTAASLTLIVHLTPDLAAKVWAKAAPDAPRGPVESRAEV